MRPGKADSMHSLETTIALNNDCDGTCRDIMPTLQELAKPIHLDKDFKVIPDFKVSPTDNLIPTDEELAELELQRLEREGLLCRLPRNQSELQSLYETVRILAGK